MLSRDELRSKSEQTVRRYKDVTLPSGGDVRIRSITRSEHRNWRKSWRKKGGEIDLQKLDFSDDMMLAMCLVDEDGKQMFTRSEALDGVFDNFDSGDTNVMVAAVNRHTNMDGETDQNSVDDAVKNSQETPSNDSSGDCAEDSE